MSAIVSATLHSLVEWPLTVIEEVLLHLSNQHLIIVMLVLVVCILMMRCLELDSKEEDEEYLINFPAGAVFTIVILLIWEVIQIVEVFV